MLPSAVVNASAFSKERTNTGRRYSTATVYGLGFLPDRYVDVENPASAPVPAASFE